MRIDLKYKYMVEVDNQNPYTLMVVTQKNGKEIVKSKTYAYTLGKLKELLRREGKEYLDEHLAALKELNAYQEKVVEDFNDIFDVVRDGQVYDKEMITIDLGDNYLGVYNPNNRVIALNKKVYDKDGNKVYELDTKTKEVTAVQATRVLEFCKWTRGFVVEFVTRSVLDKHGEEEVSMSTFCKYYKEELDNLLKVALVTRSTVELEKDEDENEVVEDVVKDTVVSDFEAIFQ